MVKQLTLDEIKQIELEILLVIDRICTENDIQYFLDAGTLLGAARHKGFIPWDDDIDIAMLRPDYERFIALVDEALPEGYVAQTPFNKRNIYQGFSKVKKLGTHYPSSCYTEDSNNDGIWVDIFCFDYCEADPSIFAKKQALYKDWYRKGNLAAVPRANSYAPLWKKFARKLVRLPYVLRGAQAYWNKLDGLGVDAADYDVDDLVVTCFYYSGFELRLRYDQVFSVKYLEFEGHMLPVYNDWEGYLEQIYGDWKTPPAPDKRGQHDVSPATQDIPL